MAEIVKYFSTEKTKTASILLLEANKFDAKLFKILLKDLKNYNLKITWVKSKLEAIEQLHNHNFDLIVTHLDTPTTDLPVALLNARKNKERVVVLTGWEMENLKVILNLIGVDKFILKSEFDLDYLPKEIGAVLENAEDLRAIQFN